MKKQRLLKLADALAADARRKKNCIKFNMNDWANVRNSEEPISCKTTACAMGFAAVSGIFKRNGLSWDQHLGFQYDKDIARSYDGFTIAQHLFGIDEDSAHFLFSALHYKRAVGKDVERVVIKRIRDFVANDGLTPEQKKPFERERARRSVFSIPPHYFSQW